MASWGFLTNQARALLCVAHDPGTRLRDIAARLDITERSAHGIITDLTAADYLVKQKDGRRNSRRGSIERERKGRQRAHGRGDHLRSLRGRARSARCDSRCPGRRRRRAKG